MSLWSKRSFTTRIVRVIEVPRSQLADFLKLPEAQQVGVYFLMGKLSDAGLPRVYIGQSGCVGSRLTQHNQNKDFWNRALVVISLTNSLTQTQALFLEWFAIVEATTAGRYSLETGTAVHNPTRPRRCRQTAKRFTKPQRSCLPHCVNPFLSHWPIRQTPATAKPVSLNFSIAKGQTPMA